MSSLVIPIEKIIGAFFPDARFSALHPVGTGNINDTWQLVIERAAGEQSYLLQRLNTHVFPYPERIEANFVQVAKHLAARNYPLAILHLQATTTGALHYTDEADQYWRVLPWLADTFAPEQLPTAAHAKTAASAYGVFLWTLKDLPGTEIQPSLPGFHDTVARFERFKEILQQDPCKRANEVSECVEQIMPFEALALEIKHTLVTGLLPCRVTHNDTKAGNILLDTRTEQAVAVIDWDTIMPGTVLADFGDMVRTFVPDRYEDDPEPYNMQLRMEVLDALLEGFLAATAGFLTPYERAHLHEGACWIISEQALRFLSDYVAGDQYYKISFPTHNLVRAQNQLALLKAVQRCRF